jgi:flagellar basal body-associated protein FliL
MAVKETIDKGKKWRNIFLIIIGVLALVAAVIWIFIGTSSLKKFVTAFVVIILVLAILFGLGYVFYLLFIKQEFKDIPAQYRKKLEEAARIAPNEMLGNLYLSGDHKHNRLKYGKYMYLRINLPKIRKFAKTDESGKVMVDEYNEPLIETETSALPIDVFIVERKAFTDKLFNDPIFILTYPQDHDYSSIFNDVVLQGFNIVPLDNYFYTIDKRNIDIDLQKAVMQNYFKEMISEVMRDLDKLVKATMNLDPRFNKEIEKGTMFELPMGGGGQNKG